MPRALRSNFSIYAPILFTDVRPDQFGLLEVTDDSPWQWRDTVKKIGAWLAREQQYEVPLGAGFGKDRAFLLVEPLSENTVSALGAAVFSHYERLEIVYRPGWRSQWFWLHPFERRRGRLSRAWPRFRAEFGEFQHQYPLSDGMARFLLKRAECTVCYGRLNPVTDSLAICASCMRRIETNDSEIERNTARARRALFS